MKQYIGTKIVKAEPMTRGDYNNYRGWQIPADEDPTDEGYLMEYENGHEQWLPKEMFEADYIEYDKNKLPATAVGMISTDYKERFKAEYAQLVIRYEGLKGMLKSGMMEHLSLNQLAHVAFTTCRSKQCLSILQCLKQGQQLKM